MTEVTYGQRENVFKQINILFKDVPSEVKVTLYEQLISLESKEREDIKNLKTSNMGDKEKLEELKLMNSYTERYATIIKEQFEIYRDKNATYSENGLPNNVIS